MNERETEADGIPANPTAAPTMSLWDLIENKQYGDYVKGPFSKPLQCYAQTSYCQSEEEWRALIKPFMED
jgi:hypothetical protein